VLVLAPGKFCTLFTLGSLSIIYGIVFIKGFQGTIDYFWNSSRK